MTTIKLFTSAEAAAKLKCKQRTLQRLCQERGVPLLAGRVLLSAEQIESLRPHVRRGVGNPNFVEGNYFGKPPKTKTAARRKAV